jgi:hypothetical protein
MTLAGPIAAGSWHLIGDGIVEAPCDVTYEVIWRHGSDDPIATFTHHFDPMTGPTKFFATPLDLDAPGVAAAASAGDQLVLRVSAEVIADAGAGLPSVFIPNGDGSNAHGRIPSLILPH